MSKDAEAPPDVPTDPKVFVRGFDFGTEEDKLQAHFAKAGKIEKIAWLSKGSAVVTYSTMKEAEVAISTLDKTVLEGNSRYMDVKLDGNTKAEAKEKKKSKPKAKPKDKGPSGPDLPRERVSEKEAKGKVIRWFGKFGFIAPAEAVDHPLAGKHNGIYVHLKDVVSGSPLAKDQEVMFKIYADESGLGAEQVAAI